MSKIHPLRRRCAWILGSLRAFLVATALLVVATAGLVHAAERRLGEALQGVGVALARLPDFVSNTPLRQLSINGVELSVVTLSTSLDIPDALGRLRGLCDRGGLEVPELLRAEARLPVRAFDGIFERVSEREGALACVDTAQKLSLGELARRLEELRETGDLSALGALRYALLRRTGGTTTVLVVTAEGRVPLAAMFPGSGDAPGFDPPGLPRPAASRRLLSAAVHDAPYGLTLYDTGAASAPALLDAQAAKLAQIGWSTRRDPEHSALIGEQDGRAIVWHAAVLADGRTFLSVAELGR